ncbi:MAG: hypothetical protein ABIN89_06250 [Chitinophagaceae bacterium]
MFLTRVGAAQDTLPHFSVIDKGSERIIISWTNPYGKAIKQLSIQRSFDSLKNYKTILTLPDPTVPQNGYVDSKATSNHMFYRLYILKDSGKYVFSMPKRPEIDTGFTLNNTVSEKPADESAGITKMNNLKELQKETQIANERIIYIKSRDVLLGGISESTLKHFRDSINYSTKDTLFMKTADTLVIRPFIAKETYRPSRYVYTDKDGNIKISLTDVVSRKYALKFFEEDQTEIFEIKHITDTLVILDKTNFIHSGWFLFELYEDGKLKERHKFYVPKDF